jgi:hypothetical protein
MHFHQQQVRLSTVVAWVVWAVGLVGVALGLVFGPDVGHLGMVTCLAGNTLMAYTFFRDLEYREKKAFELGRDHERALMMDQSDIRHLRN